MNGYLGALVLAASLGQGSPLEHSKSASLSWNSIQGTSAVFGVCFGEVSFYDTLVGPMATYSCDGLFIEGALGVHGARTGIGYAWIDRRTCVLNAPDTGVAE